MSTTIQSSLTAITNTIIDQNDSKGIKLVTNSSDNSLFDSSGEGVLIQSSGSSSGSITIGSGSPYTTNKESGSITIQSGETNYYGGSGVINITSGDTLRGASALSGEVNISSGSSTYATSGSVSLFSGDGGSTGSLSIYTGETDAGSTSQSGGITIKTGVAQGDTGTIRIEAQRSKGNSGAGGHVQIGTGNQTNASNNQNTGGLYLSSGYHDGNASTGSITVKTGMTESSGDTSGNILIYTSGADNGADVPVVATSSQNASSGEITIRTGNTYDQSSGALNLITGDTVDTISGDITIQTGVSSDGLSSDGKTIGSGQIFIKAGKSTSATSGAGNVNIETSDQDDATNTQDTGRIFILTGTHNGEGNSGRIDIQTGNTLLGNSSSGNSGRVSISSGGSDYGSSGNLNLYTGSANKENSGGAFLSTGSGVVSGNVTINSGNATGAGQTTSGNITIGTSTANTTSGDITLQTGTAPTQGEVKIVSSSVPDGTGAMPDGSDTTQRLLTSQADGTLKALGLQVLGYGRIDLSITSGHKAMFLPITFGDKASYTYDCGDGIASDYTLEETYTGVDVIDSLNAVLAYPASNLRVMTSIRSTQGYFIISNTPYFFSNLQSTGGFLHARLYFSYEVNQTGDHGIYNYSVASKSLSVQYVVLLDDLS